jgi:short-subunit dehydrogenase
MIAIKSIAKYAGGWAVITGAARAQGLGYEFARQLAAAGLNLVLVDVLDVELHERTGELQARFGIQARAVVQDLSAAPPLAALERAVADLDIDVLVCNHMFTPADAPEILDMPIELHHKLIDVNARAYVTLAHRFAGPMRDRGRGAVIIVASGAGLAPTPFASQYSANKAYQIAFGETLWYELGGTGVDVLVMIGGLMRTQGDALDRYPKWLIADVGPTVTEVLKAVGRKHLVIPGRKNRAFLLLQTRLLSRRAALQQIGRFMAKGVGKDPKQQR